MSSRRCSRCKTVKPLEEFNRAGDGHQWWCRECFRSYFRARGSKHVAQVTQARIARRARLRELARRRLAAGCASCGERDVRVLEFHHLGPKRGEISELVSAVIPAARLSEELDGCEVLCANCHRRRTAASGRWCRIGWRPERAAAFRKQVGRNLAFIFGALSAAGCRDCGEDDLVVLEFDHVGPKRASVTHLARDGVSLSTLRREIAHCEVRCVNCHRRVTAERRAPEVQSFVPP